MIVVAFPLDTAMLLGGLVIFGTGSAFGFLMARAMK